MRTTDTRERGLEALIVAALTGQAQSRGQFAATREFPAGYGAAGYVEGYPQDYDRANAVDLVKLLEFLQDTQPEEFEHLGLSEDGHPRLRFLARLQGEIAKRDVVDVLRSGIKHGPADVQLFYSAPSPGNLEARRMYETNIFSITRQLRYSRDETLRSLDLCLFINGLPVITFELKNRLTRQTVEDAIQQYKRDRDPRELLFQFGRCVVHLAVDDPETQRV